jgi:hypothetical protein
MSGQGSPGLCNYCQEQIEPNAAFVNIGPTDWNDPEQPTSRSFVPQGTEIHGWSPFVVAHPDCYAAEEGPDELLRLVEASRP